jgi:hypothetical protein
MVIAKRDPQGTKGAEMGLDSAGIWDFAIVEDYVLRTQQAYFWAD